MTTDFKFAGTVSHGTLRSADLIPAFTAVLRELQPSMEWLCVECEADLDDVDGESVEALCDALNAHAPEGYYFGAHEGDGSDFGFWETEEHANEREWGEFTEELESAYDGTSSTRKVHLTDDTFHNGGVGADCAKFVVFSFGAYGSTYVAVPYECNPYHPGVDVCEALEIAASKLAEVAPGMFTEPELDAARDELVADGEISAEDAAENDDETSDKVHARATVDLTYTESGYLVSHEWTIISESMSRAELLKFARGE